MLLALDDNLLQSVDELFSPLFGEDVLEELLGLVNSVGHLLSSLLGDSVLEIVDLASSLLLSLVTRWGVSVGLRLGSTSLVVGSAEDLVLLLSERSIGVSGAVEVLSVALELLLCLALVLLLLLLSLLLLLLSLVIGGASRSGVALVVSDPTQSVCGKMMYCDRGLTGQNGDRPWGCIGSHFHLDP